MGWVEGVVGLVGRLVAPQRCAACDGEIRHGIAFCPPCAATLVRAENPDPSRIAAFVYGGAIAETLRRFKFEDRPDLAAALAVGLIRYSAELGMGLGDLIVPVPLHPSRLVERGYNQAALLAQRLAKPLGGTCAPRLLARTRQTARQTELDRIARAGNVAQAFAVVDPARVAGREVLLVDDVETTGATLTACRAALEPWGIRRVRSIVVARAGG
jgi:ComF family protein